MNFNQSCQICAGEENPKKGNDNKDACAGDSVSSGSSYLAFNRTQNHKLLVAIVLF